MNGLVEVKLFADTVRALEVVLAQHFAKPRPVIVLLPLIVGLPVMNSTTGRTDDVCLDDVMGAGQLSCPVVVAGVPCAASQYEDRQGGLSSAAALPAAGDERLAAQLRSLFELPLAEEDEAEAAPERGQHPTSSDRLCRRDRLLIEGTGSCEPSVHRLLKGDTPELLANIIGVARSAEKGKCLQAKRAFLFRRRRGESEVQERPADRPRVADASGNLDRLLAEQFRPDRILLEVGHPTKVHKCVG